MSMLVLHVKLQPQRIKTLEMRVKSVWWVKICRFTPSVVPPKLLRKKQFLEHPPIFLCEGSCCQLMNKTTKSSPSQTGYKWVGWEVWEWTRFEEISYKLYMGCQSWSKWPIWSKKRKVNAYRSQKIPPCRKGLKAFCHCTGSNWVDNYNW